MLCWILSRYLYEKIIASRYRSQSICSSSTNWRVVATVYLVDNFSSLIRYSHFAAPISCKAFEGELGNSHRWFVWQSCSFRPLGKQTGYSHNILGLSRCFRQEIDSYCVLYVILDSNGMKQFTCQTSYISHAHKMIPIFSMTCVWVYNNTG